MLSWHAKGQLCSYCVSNTFPDHYICKLLKEGHVRAEVINILQCTCPLIQYLVVWSFEIMNPVFWGAGWDVAPHHRVKSPSQDTLVISFPLFVVQIKSGCSINMWEYECSGLLWSLRCLILCVCVWNEYLNLQYDFFNLPSFWKSGDRKGSKRTP
jgi:hypothetical protein